jgi:hypothetical protein
MNIKKYKLVIEGINPLIWNVLRKDMEDERRQLKKNQLEEFEEKNWKRKAEYKDNKEIEVIVPARWMKSMLIEACKKTRIVPHYENKKNATYTNYVGSFTVENGKPICKKKELIEHGRYMPSQGSQGGGKVWRIRPMLEKWQAEFTIVDAHGRMLDRELKELLEFGGMFIGLGDSRVENFGRFEIKELKAL